MGRQMVAPWLSPPLGSGARLCSGHTDSAPRECRVKKKSIRKNTIREKNALQACAKLDKLQRRDEAMSIR